MRIKKSGAGSSVPLFLKPFITRSRQIIADLEAPFYRTDNPMGYAVLAGIILGSFLFMLISGKNIFGALH